jgi:2-polyprenyl-3-methyl-5-hydroxy-6-metoxy-1,4-benzoquinol methylase
VRANSRAWEAHVPHRTQGTYQRIWDVADVTQAQYDQYYFSRFCDPSQAQPYGRAEPWLTFYAGIADRIVKDIAPTSVLDAGCAHGMVVEALVDRGVDAYGIDISQFAIDNVREDIRPRCWVGSITDAFPRDYELIITIETVEHMKPADAERAIDNICKHTRDVLFSSTPHDYREATHLCVRPPEYWAELFARNGFFRDTEYDVSTYLTRWAVRFRNSNEIVPRVISRYERMVWRLHTEATELRETALRDRHEVAAAEQRAIDAEQRADNEVEQQAAEIARLRRFADEIRRRRTYRLAQRIRRTVRKIAPASTRHGSLVRRLLLNRPSHKK